MKYCSQFQIPAQASTLTSCQISLKPFVTNKQRGTGLGLTISYDIVMKHHGRITAENNPEAGALFQVWLPVNNREIE